MLRRLVCTSHCVSVLLGVWLLHSGELGAQPGGPPRTLDNPQTVSLEGGSRIEFREFRAASLNEDIRYSVFLPPTYDKEPGKHYPVIYFLHGLFNDDTSWVVDRYGNLPARLEKAILEGRVPAFIMVHPQGRNSFYTDSADGTRPYEQYLKEDLIRDVEGRFRVSPKREDRSIGGTSMGGYGALKLAMKNPGLFSSVLAGSPIVLLGDDPTALWSDSTNRFGARFSELFSSIYGNPIDAEHWQQNSLEKLARAADLDGLRIRILYGTADRYNERFPMEKGVRTLQDLLSERNVSSDLRIYEGEPHGWNLIADHLEESLDFLTATFKSE